MKRLPCPVGGVAAPGKLRCDSGGPDPHRCDLFMLRERLYLAGRLRAGRSLTQHNPVPGVADLVSTEVRHGSEHFSQS